MKESIGATWIMSIVIVFIIIFSGYLALSINYSKAFRVKDGIIDRLQKHNGPNAESLADISNYMNEIGYNSKGRCDDLYSADKYISYIGVSQNISDYQGTEKYNYCVQKVYSRGSSEQMFGAYYKVVVFFSISLPLLDFANFKVSGETVYLQYPNDTAFR